MTEKSPIWQRWLVLGMALLGMGVTFSLGLWQLGRAAEKTAFQDAKTQQADKVALDGRTLGSALDDQAQRAGLIHRRMVLMGRWLPQHSVFLENRQMNAKPGFFVLTPLQIEGTNGVVLVQRGWAQRSFTDRAALPAIQTPEGQVEIEGHLAPWPSRLYDFGGVEQGPIRQNLDLQAFRQETGLGLLDVSLLQSGPASEGLLREWPVVASGVEKHHGYAFQWFGLSGLIALLYVWFQIVQPRRQKRTA
ncbi:SURF1 family protein [Limnohabitans sp.]|jgi:surfeit locus 1 family protein|uniref:SURF1 family protein n=1 Tax=Limnohabitans sp. TaxID=1907725 RepID=UPI001B4C4553|nr:SURF1 family protein [Limnohabitans sp.]MBP6221534.1 SURF1 family protein [Limnohabitans sp.]MBP6244344.1 SURF1 family protein [Limnohabitans sp.]